MGLGAIAFRAGLLPAPTQETKKGLKNPMARGNWDDFSDKYGFSEGARADDTDFQARKHLCGLLNKRPEFQAAKVRAIEFNRPGMHNPCLIVLLPALSDKNDAELLQMFHAGEIKAKAPLPDIEDAEMERMIAEAYALAVDKLASRISEDIRMALGEINRAIKMVRHKFDDRAPNTFAGKLDSRLDAARVKLLSALAA